MEWVLRSPQIHSTFGNLGFSHADGYHVNENCDAALETILHNILTEDKYLRTYRRCISFGQNIEKDLIPLLIHTKEDKTVELLIRILVNLTIPVECLLSVDTNLTTDVGRHTLFEINNLLASTKVAFTDIRATKVIVDFLKKNVDLNQNRLSTIQCSNISNTLLLLRNILHIPEENNNSSTNYNGPSHSVQNQILWNIFSQSVDKVLIKLMTIPDATNWGVTMVQLVALLYKDQHVVTLHKLINIWLETSLSESSEDNESNTSPPDRGSEDSSPLSSSDPTSDSSDTGGRNDCPNSINNRWDASSMNNTSENDNQPFQPPPPPAIPSNTPDRPSGIIDSSADTGESENARYMGVSHTHSSSKQSGDIQEKASQNEKKILISETSDCGYGTQIENQGSISTSSNEDDVPAKKPVHQKPHNPKQRANNKVRANISLQERKRKKIVKRGKTNIINVQGLSHKTPTDDDISNILKEFTVDFLLKGYNSLVQTLHSQILTNMQLEIDTSHFFWLVTYFLKFATQIELDLEQISSVLSFDIVTYLTAEGVNLCEQFELAIKLDGNDLKPTTRRLHLVVTAIREFVQAIEVYKKFSHVCNDDQQELVKLQIKICETEELRSLFVLLLRLYNPKYHSKQYLQDIIVTNHILLMFLDNVIKLPTYNGSTNIMVEHIQQFATPEIMYQYGLLLEDYSANGEFVNDCIFTIMHHVGGELERLITLFQPKILKTFTTIWKSEFEICDDWSDLIEYVINTFIKKPDTLQSPANIKLDTECFDDFKTGPNQVPTHLTQDENEPEIEKKTSNDSSKDRWTEDELSSLSWNYMQCNTLPDVVGEIVKLFKEDGITKSRDSIIQELFIQNLISKEAFETLSKGETDRTFKTIQESNEIREDEIGKLCDQLIQDGKSKFLKWVQGLLLEICFAKIYFKKFFGNIDENITATEYKQEAKVLNFELFKKKQDDLPVMSAVSYHSLLLNQSVPLVPWNCEQATVCKDLKFLQLLHKLGFHMPVDTGKVFIRIPNFWTADFLYEVSGKILPIDTSKLKFSVTDITESHSPPPNNFNVLTDFTKDITMTSTPENFYQIHKQKHLATMVNFTPMPGSSFNSEANGTNKQNWLEVVQKSQECKIIMNLGSKPTTGKDEDMEVDLVMQLPPNKENELIVSPLVVPPLIVPTPLGMPHLILPTVMSAREEISINVNNIESEYYNNCACETASVASDLTRMYVSDEDEKPEVLICPKLVVMNEICSMNEVAQTEDYDSSVISGKRKRARVQMSPTF